MKYKGDRDLVSLENFLRESIGLEVEDKEDNELEAKFLVEDGVFMLSNTSFAQVRSHVIYICLAIIPTRLGVDRVKPWN